MSIRPSNSYLRRGLSKVMNGIIGALTAVYLGFCSAIAELNVGHDRFTTVRSGTRRRFQRP